MESSQNLQQQPMQTPSQSAPPTSISSFIDHDMFSPWQYMAYDTHPPDNHSNELNVSFGKLGAPIEPFTIQPLPGTPCLLQDSPMQQGEFSSSSLPTTLSDDYLRARQSSATSLTGQPGHTESIGQRSKGFDHSHDCEEHGLELLRSLHLWPLNALKAPVKTALGPIEHPASRRNIVSDDTPCTPGFDKILLANKLALGHVMDLADCSCVRHPHVVLLYLSIVIKALFWYKRAALMLLTHESDSLDSGVANRKDPRPSILQIGGFELDDDDQADLMREILVRELRRVSKALTKLSTVSGSNTDSDILVHQWHSHLFSTTHRDLQEVVHSLKIAY